MANLESGDPQIPRNETLHRLSCGSGNESSQAQRKKGHWWICAPIKRYLKKKHNHKQDPNNAVSTNTSSIASENADGIAFLPCTREIQTTHSSMTSDSVTDNSPTCDRDKIEQLGQDLFSFFTRAIQPSAVAEEVVKKRRSWATMSTFDPSIDELIKFEALPLGIYSNEGRFLGLIQIRLDTCADANVLIRGHAEDFGWTGEDRPSKLPSIRTLGNIQIPAVGCCALGVEDPKTKERMRLVFQIVENDALMGFDCLLSESVIKSKRFLIHGEEVRDDCMRLAAVLCHSGVFRLPGLESS